MSTSLKAFISIQEVQEFLLNANTAAKDNTKPNNVDFISSSSSLCTQNQFTKGVALPYLCLKRRRLNYPSGDLCDP